LTHPFTGAPLTIRAGLDDVWRLALAHFGWQTHLPAADGVEFLAVNPHDEDSLNPEGE
ncbi:tRNA pseudouridine(65) synthase TruC, partial [Leptospira borgpetersenii serovar Hardjo-bovis]|nr:tRNA pseudouridine(65) synthase TruC [Leptospira borgpetersenii serovar Hardjo-bovis]